LADLDEFQVLPSIDSPADLKDLSISELKMLAAELRQFIIDVVSKTGGHLGSNLGSIELTIALHYIYNTPCDQIVWDVGAQAYTHKILTGRMDKFHTNRQYGGIAGFPRRDESPYDAFGAGHASTSISAALGIATARDLNGDDFRVLSVIGDGGMTGGLAFEGLNNAGVAGKDITIVFNDNSMAIYPNVGALSMMFSSIRSDLRFERIKDHMWELLGRLPKGAKLRKAVHGMGEGLRAMLMPGMWFERLGFRYIGPIDGHDLSELISMFEWIRGISGPVVVHVETEKGKGYSIAESDYTHLHGVSTFDPHVGPQNKKKKPEQFNYCQHFSDELSKIAAKDERVCAITPAMIEGSALGDFQKEFPDRCFDVGIAEEHALTFAAGLATQGLKPVVTIYSTFLQRAYDQLIHDVALQNLPVVFGVDRAGLVGEDGPTHHGAFDISYLSHIPGMMIFAPRDGQQLRLMLHAALTNENGPTAIRFPRGVPPKFDLGIEPDSNVWQPEFVRNGSKGLIISVGPLLENCIEAAKGLKKDKRWDIAVLDLRCIRPLNIEYMTVMARQYKRWLVVEENALGGGIGSQLITFLNDRGLPVSVHRIGLPDRFVTHGDRYSLWRDVGLDTESLIDVAADFFGRFHRIHRKEVHSIRIAT